MSWARRIHASNESTEGENAPDKEQDSLEHEVVSFLKKKMNVDIQSSDISACHTLKSDIKSQKPWCKKYSHSTHQPKEEKTKTNIFFNEHLTLKNNELYNYVTTM